jgi:hypothetical protein
MLTTDHLMPRLRMYGAIPPLPSRGVFTYATAVSYDLVLGKLAQALTFLTYIPVIQDSTLVRDIEYPD